MAVIEEHIRVILETYDYGGSRGWYPVAELGDADVISASAKKQCCAEGSFEIGGVYAAALNIVCRVSGLSYFGMKKCRMKVSHSYGNSPFTRIGVFYVLHVKKTGELFSVSAQDAIGWTDISSKCVGRWSCGPHLYDVCRQTAQDATLERVVENILGIAGEYVEARSGINYALKFKPFDTAANNGWTYANARVPNWQSEPDEHGMKHLVDLTIDGSRRCEQDPAVNNLVHDAHFGIYIPDGGDETNLFGNARSDIPRDFLRAAAEVAGGFIYADYGDISGGVQDTDFITIGQFGEPRWGITEIYMHEIELGRCEVADFDILPVRATIRSDLKEYSKGNGIAAQTNYAVHSYIHHDLSDNPFVDFFCRDCCPPDNAYDTDALFGRLIGSIWDSLYHMYGGNGGFTVRPFKAAVHKAADFHLGQRIRIHYMGEGESSETAYDSILTTILWTFRGGYTLACGGDDERTMADSIRASKGDKVRRALKDEMDALHANYL